MERRTNSRRYKISGQSLPLLPFRVEDEINQATVAAYTELKTDGGPFGAWTTVKVDTNGQKESFVAIGESSLNSVGAQLAGATFLPPFPCTFDEKNSRPMRRTTRAELTDGMYFVRLIVLRQGACSRPTLCIDEHRPEPAQQRRRGKRTRRTSSCWEGRRRQYGWIRIAPLRRCNGCRPRR